MPDKDEEYTRIDKGFLEVRVKVAKDGITSSTGKSKVYASTGGFRALPDGYSLNVVLIKRA